MPKNGNRPAKYRQGAISLYGDPAIDWFEEVFPAAGVNFAEQTPTSNVMRRQGWKWHRLPGGVLLLDRLLYRMVEKRFERTAGTSPSVHSAMASHDPSRARPIDEVISPESRTEFVLSLAVLRKFEAKGAGKPKHDCYRVDDYLGFSIQSENWSPSGNARELKAKTPEFCNWIEPEGYPQVLVIDDAGNGFRDLDPDKAEDKGKLPRALTDKRNHARPLVDLLIVKMNDPLPSKSKGSRLWSWLKREDHQKRFSRRVAIVSADDLRRHNMALSYRLSWDRAMSEVADAVRNTESLLHELASLGELIVRFGADGLAHIRRDESGAFNLTAIFDPEGTEGDAELAASRQHDPVRPSRMPGSTAAFLAAFVVDCSQQLRKLAPAKVSFPKAGQVALETARRYLATGFVVNRSGWLDFDDDALARKGRPEDTSRFSKSDGLMVQKSPRLWGTPAKIEDMAGAYLEHGETSLGDLPRLKFGDLLAVEQSEIEAYRTVAGLIDNHIHRPGLERPLSLAVFGKPGAGKSFGVNEIAKTLGGGKVTTIEANVAQFTRQADLVGILHEARDRIVKREIPLVFFDEFDASLGGEECAWLKAFLQPMQDGKFRDDSRTHLIDRAIFVFAGGTVYEFEDFSSPWEKGGKPRGNQQPDGQAEPTAAGIVEQPSAVSPEWLDTPQAAKCLENHAPSQANPVQLIRGHYTSERQGDQDGKERERAFRSQKRPDFISRLHGKLDIFGYDLDQRESKEGEHAFVKLRRAILLRHHLGKIAPGLFANDDVKNGKLSIAEDVQKAFLEVQRYNHGARSIESIVRMCSLRPDTHHFGVSMLPSDDQLRIHATGTFIASPR